MAAPPTSPRRRPKWRSRLLLIAGSALFALLACEIGARVFDWRQEVRAMEAWQQLDQQRFRPPREEETTLAHIIRLARNPRIVYELLPDLEFRFMGVPCRTNGHGFRSPPVPVEKPPGVFRTVVLGDSVAFGHGVEEQDAFPRQLEELLRGTQGRQVEVINTAVSGYNTAMAVATLVDKGLAFGPDLVVYHYVPNDLDLPNIIWNPQDFFRLDRSWLWEKMALAWQERDPWQQFPWDHAPEVEGRYAYVEGRTAPMYRDMVGVGMFRRELGRLKALGREHGFAVIVSIHFDSQPFVARICDEQGIAHVDIDARILARMQERGLISAEDPPHVKLRKHRESDLVLSATDPHPTPEAHRWIAEAVAARVAADGLMR